MFPPSVTLSQPKTKSQDRRQHWRYPISAAVHYQLSDIRGDCVMLDISSGGVLLKGDRILPNRAAIQLRIDWPVLLDNRCRLRLVIDGIIIRSGPSGTAVKIMRHDFRIRPKNAEPHAA